MKGLITAAACVVLAFAILCVTVVYQGRTIEQQRQLIKDMSSNPACMVEQK